MWGDVNTEIGSSKFPSFWAWRYSVAVDVMTHGPELTVLMSDIDAVFKSDPIKDIQARAR